MWAAYFGRTDAAAALIFAGADVAATDNDGCDAYRLGSVRAFMRAWAGMLRRTLPVDTTSRRSTPRPSARCGGGPVQAFAVRLALPQANKPVRNIA
jgi:hypothetical protein